LNEREALWTQLKSLTTELDETRAQLKVTTIELDETKVQLEETQGKFSYFSQKHTHFKRNPFNTHF
jgi:septal ring factor EnvC (AmiA/AmiB activator)